MSKVEFFFLYVIDRAFHIFICKRNPSSNAEVYVIEVLGSGDQLIHRGNMGVLTGTSQGIYLLLCQFVSDERHNEEKYHLRNAINASMEHITQIDTDSFLNNFGQHTLTFQEQVYKIIKEYDPVMAAQIEEQVEMHWKKKKSFSK